MQKRTLSVYFDRAVVANTPSTLEVTVTPLVTTTNPAANIVLTAVPQTQTVLLATDDSTLVTFALVPSDHLDLDETIVYRIAWRERYTGHQFSADFTMPDADTQFADLAGLGRILAVR